MDMAFLPKFYRYTYTHTHTHTYDNACIQMHEDMHRHTYDAKNENIDAYIDTQGTRIPAHTPGAVSCRSTRDATREWTHCGSGAILGQNGCSHGIFVCVNNSVCM